MGDLIHYRCPICDVQGRPIKDPESEHWICTTDTDECRVVTYTPYLS